MNPQKTIVIISFALIAGVFTWIGLEIFLKSPIEITKINVIEKPVANPAQPIKIPTEDELLENIKELPDNQIDIGLASLVIAKGVYPNIDINAYMEKLDVLTKEIKDDIQKSEYLKEILDSINSHINRYRNAKIYYSSDEELNGSFLNTVLDKSEGNCLGYTTLYLSLGERLNLSFYGMMLPHHVFIRYDDLFYQKDIEATDGNDFNLILYLIKLRAYNMIIPDKESLQYHKLTKKEIVGGMLNNRGGIKLKKGDLDGAIIDYSKAIEIDPCSDNAYYNRGSAKDEKGDINDAIADYTKAIEIMPDSVRAYCNRGITKSRKGDLDGAIIDYSKAIEINPSIAAAYRNRGNAKYNKGDTDGAITDWEHSIKLDPSYEKTLAPYLYKKR